MKNRYVYLISARTYGEVDDAPTYYKIGIASDINARFHSIKTSNPLELELEYFFKSSDARAIEVALHKEYAHLRVRGEWFSSEIFDELDQFFDECEIYGGDTVFELQPWLWRCKGTDCDNELSEEREAELIASAIMFNQNKVNRRLEQHVQPAA